jgi:transcriptional regulator with XRE-family HTH domain
MTQPAAVTLRELFGRRVQFLRKSRGLTQEVLAEKIGISIDFLSLIERGRNSPSFDNLEQFGQAFGLPVAALFSFAEDSDESK